MSDVEAKHSSVLSEVPTGVCRLGVWSAGADLFWDRMLQLKQLSAGLALTGLEPSVVSTVASVNRIAADAVQVIYGTPDGTLKERLLNRADEAKISIAVTERPWAFDGDGEMFKLTVEARRIDLAFFFDPMMVVHTSNVDPLPKQITVVYESMLPRQPLRFVLADDPDAGKTIMAGLYMRELIMRADSRRILVVAPGSLVEQWRDEMFEKFGLEFRVYSKGLDAATATGNPFDTEPGWGVAPSTTNSRRCSHAPKESRS